MERRNAWLRQSYAQSRGQGLRRSAGRILSPLWGHIASPQVSVRIPPGRPKSPGTLSFLDNLLDVRIVKYLARIASETLEYVYTGNC